MHVIPWSKTSTKIKFPNSPLHSRSCHILRNLLEFDLYSFPFSPLQICGLIFFSRKQKKERRGSHQEVQINPWMIRMIEVILILLHHLPISGLELEPDTFSIPNNLVRSSQQFPLHLHQIVQNSFPDTKYTFFV